MVAGNLWWLEIAVSVLLTRGNWQNGEEKRFTAFDWHFERPTFTQIITTNVLTAVSPNMSIVLIMFIATLPLIGRRFDALHSRHRTIFSEIGADLGKGLVSVRRMVVAIFMLSLQGSATTMHATNILFLMLSSGLSVDNKF